LRAEGRLQVMEMASESCARKAGRVYPFARPVFSRQGTCGAASHCIVEELGARFDLRGAAQTVLFDVHREAITPDNLDRAIELLPALRRIAREARRAW
jgi:hypothetical protein